jgi:predicted heme/steroid binding protein
LKVNFGGDAVMRISQYHKEILLINHNIQCFQQIIASTTDPDQRMFYQNLLDSEIRRLNYWQWYYQQANKGYGDEVIPNQREFTLEELAQYDGSGGRLAYVAVNGIVYDVSLESTWGGGTHFSLYSGKDLTAQFDGCHSGKVEILRNLPIVGVLIG